MIYPQDIKGWKKLEMIERPNNPNQFEDDLRNSKEGELKGRDQFNRWAIYLEGSTLKICVYIRKRFCC